MATGHEFAQVVPTLVGFGQQGHVGGVLATDDLAFVIQRRGGEVDLAAKDGLDLLFQAVLVKLDGTVEVAVVGHGHGGHAQLRGPFGQIPGADHAVKQRKFGVQVKVDEGIGHGTARA